MNELTALLEEATAALARMDEETLGSLEARALALTPVAPADEVMARFRVFASVLQGTGKGLDVLRRVHGLKGEEAWVR